MDAVRYLEETRRMCRFFSHVSCIGCPALINRQNYMFADVIVNYGTKTTDAVKIVEEWSKENPIKTRNSEFLKLYPNADVLDNGVVSLCPILIDGYNPSAGWCCDTDCYDCKTKYWMQRNENKIECRQCQYLMFSDCYGECSKGNISGVVKPHFSCGKGVDKNDNLSVKEVEQ